MSKTRFSILISMLSFFVLTAFVVAPPKTEKVVIKTKIYCDHCKVCEDCEPHIVSAVEELKGVVSATLDLEKEEITVWYKPKKTNAEAIRNSIINCGFAADNLPPNPEAYEKLDGCCKKAE